MREWRGTIGICANRCHEPRPVCASVPSTHYSAGKRMGRDGRGGRVGNGGLGGGIGRGLFGGRRRGDGPEFFASAYHPLFFVRAHPNNKSMLNEPVSHERGSSLAVSCCCRVRACRVRACTMHELSPCCALETPVMDIVPNKLSKCSSAHTHEHSQYHISKTPARVFACVSVCVCTSPSRPSLSVLHTRPSLPLRSAHALHMRRRGRCDCARPHTARTAGTSATHSLLTYHSQP